MPSAAQGNVFITGAAAGIGAATTRLLASAGFTVYAGVHKDTGSLDQVAGVQLVPIDVTDPDSVTTAASRVADDLSGRGGLHALVNNAGIIVQGPLELTPPADLERQFAVNTLGPAYTTRAFLPLLREGHGRVINVGAPTARVPMPYLPALSASKAALAALSDAVRMELAPWHIPVIVVVPGLADTQIFAKAETAAAAALSVADPAQAALYQARIAAVAAASARQRPRPAAAVARTILTAVQARSPKRRYVSGPDARLAGVLAAFPASLREAVITRILGLRAA